MPNVIPKLSEQLPKVKASIPEITKFILLALGWIVGRIVHVEVDKVVNPGEGKDVLFKFPSLLDSSKNYIFTYGDLAMFAAAALISWLLFKWGRFLKWFGVGIFLYIVTFEIYELLYGEILSPVQPLVPGQSSTDGGVGF